jgi:hypothetical protein
MFLTSTGPSLKSVLWSLRCSSSGATLLSLCVLTSDTADVIPSHTAAPIVSLMGVRSARFLLSCDDSCVMCYHLGVMVLVVWNTGSTTLGATRTSTTCSLRAQMLTSSTLWRQMYWESCYPVKRYVLCAAHAVHVNVSWDHNVGHQPYRPILVRRVNDVTRLALYYA